MTPCDCLSLPQSWRRIWLRAAMALLLVSTVWSAAAQALTPAAAPAVADRARAATSSFVVAQAFWADGNGTADFATARAQHYTPYHGTFSQGYASATHWIRLRLAAHDQPLGMRITPAWLDRLTLYDPATGAPVRVVGDTVDPAANALGGPGASFVLAAHAQARDIWLKLESNSAHRARIEVAPIPEAMQFGLRMVLWASAYAALLVFSLLALMALWWARRDTVLRIYLWRHAVFTYYATAYLGLPTLLWGGWLPPAFFDWAFSLSVTMVVPMSIRFDRAFMADYRPNKYLVTGFMVLGTCGWLLVAALLMGYARQALQLNVYLIIATSLFMLLSALSTRPQAGKAMLIPRRVMQAYYLAIFLSLWVGLGAILGWFGEQFWATYGLVLNGLIGNLLMVLILVARAIRQNKQEQRTQLQLQQAQQEVAFEQSRREEQSKFLHMLMHELKTPLSVISLALGTQHNRESNFKLAGRAIQDMSAIIDRCAVADRMARSTPQFREQSIDVMQLVREAVDDVAGLPSRIQWVAQASPQALSVDIQLLAKIIKNLLDNAARYSAPLSAIQVAVRVDAQAKPERLVLTLSNVAGIAGVPDPERVFEKYYRSPGAKRISGSGLGLYLSRQLARSLGGDLTYRLNEHFVEFELWLPLSPR